ncbi:MAG: transposase [Phycisphaerae bacterium]|nr:transposase [Phycisphaerae bacterium]
MLIDGKYTNKLKRYDVPFHAHELTFSCYKKQTFMAKERTCQWLVDSIQYCREKHNFALWAYVFMPNHVHMLIYSRKEEYSISQIASDLKRPVAQRAIAWLKRENPIGLKFLQTGQKKQKYRFWQAGGGYDRNIINTETLINVVRYIHGNPVRKGFADRSAQWYYSSAAAWLESKNEPIKIDKSDWPL